MPAGMPHIRNCFWRPEKPQQPCLAATTKPPLLPRARGDRDPPQRWISQEGSEYGDLIQMCASPVTKFIPPGSGGVPILPPPRWVDGEPALHQITEDIARPLEGRPGKGWWICFSLAFAGLLNLAGMVTYLISTGIGVWGLNNSVGWAFDITNFVFWIGIGHAGTLISAILLLFRQQ